MIHPLHRLKKEFSRWQAYIGFLVPFLLAVAIGLAIHAHSKPITLAQSSTTSSNTVAGGGTLPSAADVTAANAAILAYCSSDLRQDTSCALVDGSTVTAPGFVETGLKMNGSFATDGSGNQGVALTKQTNGTWQVIWVGQGCVPTAIASKYNVPNTFSLCAS